MRNVDTVPAYLATEEHVMNRGAVDLVGGETLANLNIAGRQIMNANPNRYNNPNGIDKNVPLKLPMKFANGTDKPGGIARLGKSFDQGNVKYLPASSGNMPGLAGVIKQGNSYSQAPGFIPTDTVRVPSGIYPIQGYEGGTGRLGVQNPFDARMEAYNNAFNARQNDPAYINYLNANAGGDTNKADQEYSKYLKIKHFKPDMGYESGTLDESGVTRPLHPPSLLDTVKGIFSSGSEPVQPSAPIQGSDYAPTLEQARKNQELQPGGMAVPAVVRGYMNGTDNPVGVPRSGLFGMASAIEDPNNPDRLLREKQSMDRVPFVRGLPTQSQPSFFDEAKRSVGNVIDDYANKFTQNGNNPAPARPSLPPINNIINADPVGNVDNPTMPPLLMQNQQPYNMKGARSGGNVNTLNIDLGDGRKGLVQFANGKKLLPEQVYGLESRIAYNQSPHAIEQFAKEAAISQGRYDDYHNKLNANNANNQEANLLDIALNGGGRGDMTFSEFGAANRRQKAAQQALGLYLNRNQAANNLAENKRQFRLANEAAKNKALYDFQLESKKLDQPKYQAVNTYDDTGTINGNELVDIKTGNRIGGNSDNRFQVQLKRLLSAGLSQDQLTQVLNELAAAE